MITRLFALFIATSFFMANGPLLYAVETNVWSERRNAQNKKSDSYQVSSLPAPLQNNGLARPETLIKQFPKLNKSLEKVVRPTMEKKANGANGSFLLLLESLPRSSAQLQKVYRPFVKVAKTPEDERVVFLIQDIHMNYEAQSNIARVFKALTEKTPEAYPGQTLSIAVEGAYGEFDFSKFRSFPDEELVKDVADFFMQEGVIAAPSYTGIAMPNDAPPFYGIDDPVHYKANVKAYQDSMTTKGPLLANLENTKQVLMEEKRKTLNKKLMEFDNFQVAHQKGDIDLGVYLKKLTKLQLEGASRNNEDGAFELVIEKFVSAYELEKKMNFDRVERERTIVIRQLAAKLKKEEITEMIQMGLGYRLGKISYADYYRSILKLFKRHSISLKSVPEFNRYVQYVLLADSIESTELFDAIQRFERDVSQNLIQNEKERDLMNRSRRAYLEGKLLEFALIPEEWEEYSKIPVTTRKESLAPFERFYREADIRSEKMVENLIKQMDDDEAQVGALLVGGFHTPHMTTKLRGKGLNVAVVQPNITKIDNLSGTEYLSAFTREKTPIERMFEGRKLFLAIARQAVGSPIAEAQAPTVDVLTTTLIQSAPVEPGVVTVPGVGVVETLADGTVLAQLEGSNERVAVTFNPGQPQSGYQPVGDVRTHRAGSQFRPFQFLAQIPSLLSRLLGPKEAPQLQGSTLTLPSTYTVGRGFFYALFGLGFLIRAFGGLRALNRAVEIFFAPFWEMPASLFKNFADWHASDNQSQFLKRRIGAENIRSATWFGASFGLVLSIVLVYFGMLGMAVGWFETPVQALTFVLLASVALTVLSMGAFNAGTHMVYNIRNPDAVLSMDSQFAWWDGFDEFKMPATDQSGARSSRLKKGYKTAPITLDGLTRVGVSRNGEPPAVLIERSDGTRNDEQATQAWVYFPEGQEAYSFRTGIPVEQTRVGNAILLRRGEKIYLGKDPNGHIMNFGDEYLSMYHLQIEMDFEGRIIVTDLFSNNGSNVRVLSPAAGQDLDFRPGQTQEESSDALPAVQPDIAVAANAGAGASIILSLFDIKVEDERDAGSAEESESQKLRKERGSIEDRIERVNDKLKVIPRDHPEYFDIRFKLTRIRRILSLRDNDQLNARGVTRDQGNNTMLFLLRDIEDMVTRATTMEEMLTQSLSVESAFIERHRDALNEGGIGTRLRGVRQNFDVFTYLYEFRGDTNYFVAVKMDADGNLIAVELERRVELERDGEDNITVLTRVPLVNGNVDGLITREDLANEESNAQEVKLMSGEDGVVQVQLVWPNADPTIFVIDVTQVDSLVRIEKQGDLKLNTVPAPKMGRRLNVLPASKKPLQPIPAPPLPSGAKKQPQANLDDFVVKTNDVQTKSRASRLLGLKTQRKPGEQNEDRVMLLRMPKDGREFGAFTADGMGSEGQDPDTGDHVGSGVGAYAFASRILGYITGAIKTKGQLLGRIRRALIEGHWGIIAELRKRGMFKGATTISGYIPYRVGNKMYAAVYNIGDSSVIVYRNGKLQTLQAADNIAGYQFQQAQKDEGDNRGFMTIQGAIQNPMVFNSLGIDSFKIEETNLTVVEIEPGDVILTASDGVTENFKRSQELINLIEDNLSANRTESNAQQISDAIAQDLIDKARRYKAAKAKRNSSGDISLTTDEKQILDDFKGDDAGFTLEVVGADFGKDLVVSDDETDPSRFKTFKVVDEWTFTGPSGLETPYRDEMGLEVTVGKGKFRIEDKAKKGPVLIEEETGKEFEIPTDDPLVLYVTQMGNEEQVFVMRKSAAEKAAERRASQGQQPRQGVFLLNDYIAEFQYDPALQTVHVRDVGIRSKFQKRGIKITESTGMGQKYLKSGPRPLDTALTLPWVLWIGRVLFAPIGIVFGVKVSDALTSLFIAPIIEVPFTLRSSFVGAHKPSTSAARRYLEEGQRTIIRATWAGLIFGIVSSLAVMIFFSVAFSLGFPVFFSSLSTLEMVGLAFIPIAPAIAANSGAHFYRNLLTIVFNLTRLNVPSIIRMGMSLVEVRKDIDSFTYVYKVSGQDQFFIAVKLNSDGKLIALELERKDDKTGILQKVPLANGNLDGLLLRRDANDASTAATELNLFASGTDIVSVLVAWPNGDSTTYIINLRNTDDLVQIENEAELDDPDFIGLSKESLTLPFVLWIGRVLFAPIGIVFGVKVSDALTSLFIAPIIEVPFTLRSSFVGAHKPSTSAARRYLEEGQRTIIRATWAGLIFGIVSSLAVMIFFSVAFSLGFPVFFSSLSTLEMVGLAFIPIAPAIAANSGAHFYRNLLSVYSNIARWSQARARAKDLLALQGDIEAQLNQGRSINQILNDLQVPPIVRLGLDEAALDAAALSRLAGSHFRSTLTENGANLSEEVPAFSHFENAKPESITQYGQTRAQSADQQEGGLTVVRMMDPDATKASFEQEKTALVNEIGENGRGLLIVPASMAGKVTAKEIAQFNKAGITLISNSRTLRLDSDFIAAQTGIPFGNAKIFISKKAQARLSDVTIGSLKELEGLNEPGRRVEIFLTLLEQNVFVAVPISVTELVNLKLFKERLIRIQA